MKTDEHLEPNASRDNTDPMPMRKALGVIKSLVSENERAFWLALEVYLSDAALNKELLVPMSTVLATLAEGVETLFAGDSEDEDQGTDEAGE